MSIKYMTMVFDLDIAPGPKLVFLALADRADDQGHCYPSQKDLAKKSTMTVRSVQTHLKWLEDEGYIERTERRRNDGYRTSDDYKILSQQKRRVETQHENISHEKFSPENLSPENNGYSQAKTFRPNINLPSEALSEPSIEPSQRADRFDDFWKAYPRKDGMVQSRAAFQDEIQRRGADPDLIVRAAIAYARKKAGSEERYILLPANWLTRQTYKDPGLDRPEPLPIDLSALEEWKRPIAERLGVAFVAAWLEGAIRDGPSLRVTSALAQSFLTERYAIDLAKFGITEIVHNPPATETP